MLPPVLLPAPRAALSRAGARAALSVSTALALAALSLSATLPASAADEVPDLADTAVVEPTDTVEDPATGDAVTGSRPSAPREGPDPLAGGTPSASPSTPQSAPSSEPPPVTAGPRCPGGAWGATPVSGALDPVSGQRYGATPLAPDRLDLRLLDDTGALGAPVARLALPGARLAGDGLDGGGLALDAAGHLYVVAATIDPAPAPGRAVTARLYRTSTPVAAPETGSRLTAVPVSTTRVDRAVVRIGFDAGGLLHLVHADGSTRVDPSTGRVVDASTPAAGQTLACGRASHVELRVVTRRGADAPDARPLLVGPGHPASRASDSGVVVPGATYDLRVLDPAASTGRPSYDVGWTCRDQTGRLVPTTDRTYVAPDRAFGSVVTCTAVLRPAPAREPRVRPTARRTGDLLTATGPTARTERATKRQDPGTGGLGGGFPGLGLTGGGGGDDDTTDPTDPTGTAPAPDTADARPPAGLGLGSFGTTGVQQRPRAAGSARGAGAGAAAEDDGPLDPVLPDTGGPSAVALPIGLGSVVAGAVLLLRRRRPSAGS